MGTRILKPGYPEPQFSTSTHTVILVDAIYLGGSVSRYIEVADGAATVDATINGVISDSQRQRGEAE